MNFIIGIDGGGTKTIGTIIDSATFNQTADQTPSQALSASRHFKITSGPSSLSQNFTASMACLVTLIQQLLSAAQAKPKDTSITLGLAGAGDETLAQKCETFLTGIFQFGKINVVEDCVTSLHGAALYSNNKNIALITLGTGSFVAKLNHSKATFSGGWGFPIGDEGSGAKLGFYAIQAFLKQWDKLANDSTFNEYVSPLYGALSTLIGANGNSEHANKTLILKWLSNAGQAEFAAIAPLVFQYIDTCDFAKRLLDDHINDVVNMLNDATALGGAETSDAHWAQLQPQAQTQAHVLQQKTSYFLTGGLAEPTWNVLPERWQSLVRVIDNPSLNGALMLAGLNFKQEPSTALNQENLNVEVPTPLKLTNLDLLVSEQRNPESMSLDVMSSKDITALMNQQDSLVSQQLEPILPTISIAIDTIKTAFNRGGRLIYMGAGTSGRLGVLDAVECPPTFSTPHDLIIGLIAGGESAMFKAVEGAEDDEKLGVTDLIELNISELDILVGIAASGRTPYVIGGIKHAQSVGAKTISVTCNPQATINDLADIAIAANVGPEVLTGSTRLKAGTAQKMILNMLSTGALVQLGKCYENLMVDVNVSNIKLRQRAVRIIQQAAKCNEDIADSSLVLAENNVKLAILVSILRADTTQKESLSSIAIEELKSALLKNNGDLRKTMSDLNIKIGIKIKHITKNGD